MWQPHYRWTQQQGKWGECSLIIQLFLYEDYVDRDLNVFFCSECWNQKVKERMKIYYICDEAWKKKSGMGWLPS